MLSWSFPVGCKLARLGLAVVIAALAAAPAAAQMPLPSDRWFIDVNFGLQPGSRTFSEISTPIIYDEPASVTTAHKVEGLKALLDLGGGIRFGGNLGAGAAYVRFEGSDNGETTARVPHPVQFNQPRTAVFAAEALQHVESALHLFALWDLPLSERIGVAVFAGPSLVTVKQDIVTGIVLGAEEPPFARAAIASLATAERTDTAFGINLGTDVAYFMTPAIGFGMTIRYVKASVDLGPEGSALNGLDAGGWQFGFGARLRFRK
jgi:Outer membrane protein beta-barrel domain